MSDKTVSDLVVERLTAWGVPRVFGYSGDGIDGVMGALRRAGPSGCAGSPWARLVFSTYR
jgi:thiamine pyrophosphate-dependent acetolactate synthase large subunit-like protein